MNYNVTIPSVTFRFTVEIGHITNARFTEITGLKYSASVSPFREGGNNLHEVQLIEPGKFEPVTLKKGFYTKGSELYQWLYKYITAGEAQEPLDVTINMLDINGGIMGTYTLYNAIPLEYEGPTLQAASQEIAIESLKMAYDFFEYEAGPEEQSVMEGQKTLINKLEDAVNDNPTLKAAKEGIKDVSEKVKDKLGNFRTGF